MIKAASDAAKENGGKTLILAVTVLTSMDQSDLIATGVEKSPAVQVVALAKMAKENGADGVICSPLEIDAIRQAVLGEGHFLGGAHTMAAMERDYYYPPLADRNPPITWCQEGRKTAWQRANAKAKEILAKPGPDHLEPSEERAIRKSFDIRLGGA